MMRSIRPWRRLLGIATASAALAPCRAHAADDPQRPKPDRADLALDAKRAPAAFDLLTRGEGKLAAGSVADALKLFEQAAEVAPSSAVVARRRCQALTELGRGDAKQACQQALAVGNSAAEMRAVVSAIGAAPRSPTPDDLRLASLFAGALSRRQPEQPWGPAAECDLARRLGDWPAYRVCSETLSRVAPDHYETRRALSITPPDVRRSFIAWLALGLACLATLIHGLQRALRSRSVRASVASALVLFAVSIPARAAEPEHVQQSPEPRGPTGEPGSGFAQKWPINLQEPEKGIPTEDQRSRDPLEFGYHLMDLTEAGERAVKQGDYKKALKFYEAIAKAVPDVSRGFMLVCETYERLGDRQNALRACTLGLTKNGVRIVDYKLYTRVVLTKPGKLTADEVADLSQVVGHLRSQSEDAAKDLAVSIQCEIGLRNSEVKPLEECVSLATKKAPDDPHTISYAFALALAKRDLAKASELVQRARKTKMTPAGIQKMEQAVAAAQPIWKRVLGDWRATLGVALALVGLLVATMFFVVRRRGALRTRAASVAASL